MTDMPRNQFKAAIREGRHQRGIWCTLRDSLAAEMLAGCGFDWMLFDTEHSPMDALTVLPLLQAVAPYPVSAIVRPTSQDPAEIKKLLDFGAQTILVPYVQSAEEAARAVASVTYPPAGIRGVSAMTRATRFATIPGYHARASEEICLIVQVETAEALDAIEAIAAVPGIDGIFVGPSDLAASLGHPGNPGHPEVRARVVEAIARIRAAGLPPGVLAVDPALFDATLEAGAVFAARDVDIAALRRGLSPRD